CKCRGECAGCDDRGHPTPDEIGGQLRQSVKLALRPTVFDGYVSALDIAGLFEAPTERRYRHRRGRGRVEEPDLRDDARLLRPCREGPRHRAPEPCNELPPPHSITSSARASRFGGIVRPSALAVLRLITSSNLVGCCTGRSAGFSPLRMRPT